MVSVRRFPRRSRVARLSRSNSAALSVRRLLRLKSITFRFSPSKRPGGSSSSAFRLKFSNFKDLKFLRVKLRHSNHHATPRCSPRQIRKSLIFKHASKIKNLPLTPCYLFECLWTFFLQSLAKWLPKLHIFEEKRYEETEETLSIWHIMGNPGLNPISSCPRSLDFLRISETPKN